MKRYILAAALALTPGFAFAVSLLSGGTIAPDAYFDSWLDGSEADFFGTVLASGSSTVIRNRDSFDRAEVIEDLFVGSATIDWQVSSSASGRTPARQGEVRPARGRSDCVKYELL